MLTDRQQQVLEWLRSGKSEKEIARGLGRSRFTVHAHVTAIYKALHVSSRPELMARFIVSEPAMNDSGSGSGRCDHAGSWSDLGC
jgi:DNA-binding CsgD family transcriptional regulator